LNRHGNSYEEKAVVWKPILLSLGSNETLRFVSLDVVGLQNRCFASVRETIIAALAFSSSMVSVKAMKQDLGTTFASAIPMDAGRV